MKKYSESHEWVELEGDVAVVGITAHASEELGDLVFVELPQVDAEFIVGDNAVVLESVKAASDVLAPCGGKVIAINESLNEDPELVNRDPEGEGWLFRLETNTLDDLNSLMDEKDYLASLE